MNRASDARESIITRLRNGGNLRCAKHCLSFAVDTWDAVAAIMTYQKPSFVGPGCGTPPCNATHISVTDVHPAGFPLQPWGAPKKQVHINDVFAIILGFQGAEFPGPDLASCP